MLSIGAPALCDLLPPWRLPLLYKAVFDGEDIFSDIYHSTEDVIENIMQILT